MKCCYYVTEPLVQIITQCKCPHLKNNVMYSPRFAMFTSFTTYSDDLIESDDHKIRFAQVTRPYGKPRLEKEKIGVEQ